MIAILRDSVFIAKRRVEWTDFIVAQQKRARRIVFDGKTYLTVSQESFSMEQCVGCVNLLREIVLALT